MKQISNFDQLTSKFEDRTQKSFFLRHEENKQYIWNNSKTILYI